MQTTSPKLPGIDYVVKNWALAMMLQALPLGHFWSILLLKSKMMTSFRENVKNAGLISAKPICPENKHKIGHFLPIAFQRSLSGKLSLKILRNLTFLRDLSEALAWVAVERCPSVSQESF